MRIKIKDKIYDAASLNQVSLKDVLKFEQETEEFGHRLTWSEVQDMTSRVEAMSPEERGQSTEALWLTAVAVWATRRIAGEPVTFDQAIDFPAHELQLLPDPQDHKAPKAKGAKAKTASAQDVKPELQAVKTG